MDSGHTHNSNFEIHLHTQTSSKIDGEAAAQSLVAALVTKQSVDPYNVQGEIGVHGVAEAINYLNLVKEFGTRLIAADDLLERFQRVLGHKPYRFMRRGIVFSHRDFRSDPRSI